MSNERDELAKILGRDDLYNDSGCCDWIVAVIAAEAILAAGYRKPRTITTATELDALPVGSVVMDVDGEPWRKMRPNLWASRDSCEESTTVFWTHSEIHPTVLHEAVAQ